MQSKSQDVHFYRLSQLKEKLSVSRSSIWSWVKDGSFPKPIKLGKKHSDETKQKMSKSAMGRESPFKGKTMTPEQRTKVSQAAKQRIPLICHCCKTVDPVNFRRWH